MPEGRRFPRPVHGIGDDDPLAAPQVLVRVRQRPAFGQGALVAVHEVAEVVADEHYEPVFGGDDGPAAALLGAPFRPFAPQQHRVFRVVDGIPQRLQVVPGRHLLRRRAVGQVEDSHALAAGVFDEFKRPGNRARLFGTHEGHPGLRAVALVVVDTPGVIRRVVQDRFVKVQHHGRRLVLISAGLLGGGGSPALIVERAVEHRLRQLVHADGVRPVLHGRLGPQRGVETVVRSRALSLGGHRDECQRAHGRHEQGACARRFHRLPSPSRLSRSFGIQPSFSRWRHSIIGNASTRGAGPRIR